MTTICILFSAIIIGYLFRNSKLPNIPAWVLQAIVWALLFFFGIVIGSDRNILDNLGIFGIKALFIAVAGMVGSIVMACILSRLLRKGGNDNER